MILERKLKQDLAALADSHWAIQVRTKHPDGTTIDGVVLDDKKTYIVLQEISSFEPDGVIVLPKKWIKSIRNGKIEKCMNEVLQQQPAIDYGAVGASYRAFDKIEELIMHLHVADIWPAIEVLFNGQASLYMGPVTAVGKRSFTLACFDAAGEWEKEYELEYREIFKIEIDSKYVAHLNAYMRRKPAPA